MPPGRSFLRVLFAIAAAVYALPLLVSISLPFAYWDWLMTPYYQLRENAHEWGALFGNVVFTFFQDGIQFRPVSTILINLQYLIFRGEFWLWYLVKWLVFAACIYFVHKWVLVLTRSRWAALASGAYFVLHPMPLVLDVISQDAYVVLFGSMALTWLATKPGQEPFRQRLGPLSHVDFAVFLVLCALAALSKEIGVVFLIALLILLLAGEWRDFSAKTLVRYGCLLALVLFCAFRIVQVRHPTSQVGLLFSGDVQEFIWHIVDRYMRTCGYLLPASSRSILEILTGFCIGAGCVAIVVARRGLLPALLFAASGLAGSIFVIASAYSCPKYMPVPVMFFAFLVGIAIAALESSFAQAARVLATVFVVLMAVAAPAKIFSQWLGMTQSLYEMSDIINFMETKAREGYALRGTGLASENEVRWEKIATFREFFKISSVRWYGYERPIEFEVLKEKSPPANGRFVLLTSVTPKDIAQGALASVGVASLRGVTGVYVYERERYGVFETMTGWLKRLDRRLGIDLRDPIDCQPPQPSRFAPGMPNPMHPLAYFPFHAGPHFLYVFDGKSDAEPAPQDIEVNSLPPLRRYGSFGR